jgi:molybdate transport system regulatory protein
VATARLTLRVDLGGNRAIGPGKIRLLEAIRDIGSITRAGAALGMSYRRAGRVALSGFFTLRVAS